MAHLSTFAIYLQRVTAKLIKVTRDMRAHSTIVHTLYLAGNGINAKSHIQTGLSSSPIRGNIEQ